MESELDLAEICEAVDDAQMRAHIAHDGGSQWPDQTYEDGVQAALEWVVGLGPCPFPPDDDTLADAD